MHGSAFAVLDALAHADDGLGLTALARASGLAKTSAHRLAEQLITLGAVQYAGQRYYVGARMQRIGQRWQPDPLLRCTAQGPVHFLAVRSRAVVALRILYECMSTGSAISVLPHPTVTPTCLIRQIRSRSRVPPPGGSCMPPNRLMSRFQTAGLTANGATCARPSATRAPPSWITRTDNVPESHSATRTRVPGPRRHRSLMCRIIGHYP